MYINPLGKAVIDVTSVCASLRAQNEELRGALAEMIRLEDAPMYAGWKQDWLTSVGEARAALAKQGGGS